MQVILQNITNTFGDPHQSSISAMLVGITDGQSIVVGRTSERAGMVVRRDPRMSATHFRITCDGRRAVLRDLKSSNGTFLNGQRVVEAELNDGDEILAGSTRFAVGIIAQLVEPAMELPPSDTLAPPVVPRQPEQQPSISPEKAEPPPMQAYLEIVSGPLKVSGDSEFGQFLDRVTAGGTVQVGRSVFGPDMLMHQDMMMSGSHFEISCDGKTCLLRDLNSTNGTYVNGTRVSQALLRNEDRILAGQTTFAVHISGGTALSDADVAGAIRVAEEPGTEEISKSTVEVEGLRVVNETPFKFAPLPGRMNFPQHSMTLIVKGTFQLAHGHVAALADEQEPLSGPKFYEDDEEQRGSLRYDSDFAFFKPRADLLLVGTCYVPDGVPVREIQAGFRVGPHGKLLNIFGNRHWDVGWFGHREEAERFTEMELRYENSFGGPKYAQNPVGKGHRKIRDESGASLLPLPNLESPDDPVDSCFDRPVPAGFGPLSPEWGDRKRLLGTYDKKWLSNRWPWFPDDFHWRYFNSAQPDLQVKDYLQGGEDVFLRNLRPDQPDYYSQLPGLRVRCFLNTISEISKNGHPDESFQEVPMVLDTLWIDTEEEKLILVWRGVADVRSEDFPEVQDVFITAEPVGQPERTVEECRARFLEIRTAEDEQFEPPVEEPEPPPPQETLADGAPDDEEDELDREAAANWQRTEQELQNTILAAGLDPDNLPVPTQEQQFEHKILLKELGIEIDEEEEEDAEEESASGKGENPQAADGSQGWTRERVVEHAAAGGKFADEDLSGLDLSEADLSGADFERAILTGVKLHKAKLAGATFVLANLARADLSSADLTDADLTESDLTEAVLVEAALNNALLKTAMLARAKLNNASLAGADAADAFFTEADLTEADLGGANLKGTDFSKSRLDRANFQDANLLEADLQLAAGQGIDFTRANLVKLRAGRGCDFPDAILREAVGDDSAWTKARLVNADFSYARMHSAMFNGAVLQGGNLHAADMKFARFVKADLKNARLTEMNLFEGSLEQADLTEADLSGSNMYGAEFRDAGMNETCFESTNLKMTKLYG